MAAYSDNGFVMIALALRFASELGLPSVVEQLIAKGPSRGRTIENDEREMYRLSRVWYGVCNLELLCEISPHSPRDGY
jgi:hypothetical protein